MSTFQVIKDELVATCSAALTALEIMHEHARLAAARGASALDLRVERDDGSLISYHGKYNAAWRTRRGASTSLPERVGPGELGL